jgi:hypothetical protein
MTRHSRIARARDTSVDQDVTLASFSELGIRRDMQRRDRAAFG